MTFEQENALYQFLEIAVEPFTLESITSFVCSLKTKRLNRLSMEIEDYLNVYRLAFPLGRRRWISIRGYFEDACFVIQPSRLEIVSGILIPGHRCIPFANSERLPQDYTFLWGKKVIPFTTVEGEPEEFYPYYSVLGEEYAPQYVARNNPENEEAFNNEFDDPVEVSIKALDMRTLYRETKFVPGDLFEVRIVDWKKNAFSLKKIEKGAWNERGLREWQEAAEKGFGSSFVNLGPGVSTEEQIAYAYFYGGKRMKETPAYSLEEFLYERTDCIETTLYGMETRFWSAGKDIPDMGELTGQRIVKRTPIEEMLLANKAPMSEFVVQSYVLDMLFRKETKAQDVAMRIAPPVIAKNFESREWNMLVDYITEIYEEFSKEYSLFKDKGMGPVRQKAAELHTAVVEFAAGLRPDSINAAYLPQHTFIVLSQIQNHMAGLMDELCLNEEVSDVELDSMNNVIDGMADAYDEIKELVEDAMRNFRRNNIAMVKSSTKTEARLIQIGIGGTNVWRRIVMPECYSLEALHIVIQRVFHWENNFAYRFTLKPMPLSANKASDGAFSTEELPKNLTIDILNKTGLVDFIYECGPWTIKIMILSPSEGGVACVAGEYAAPNQNINGPVRFKKAVFLLNAGSIEEKRSAKQELGESFTPEFFDLVQCNEWLQGNY
ncbi:MAG: plasmid pRiA4b ORF-3 family protein [Treponema sp.]|jgi:hypothetical protein|nr:plasmid pRiA4b ORF-3 family protein [Treponema sp.]